MRELPQADHADLGLIEDDNTPDMRTAPVLLDAPTSSGSRSEHPNPSV